MPATSPASQRAPVTPFGHGHARGHARARRRRGGRRRAPRSQPGRSPRASRRGRRRRRRAASAAPRPAARAGEAHVLGDAELARKRLELGLLRPVADERERAAAPRRARLREGLEQPREVLARDEVADGHDARPVAVPAERAAATAASPSTNASSVDARADDVQAVAERAGDRLQARAEVVRDREHRAGVGDGLRGRLADPRRALGVGDVGAVRGQRVGHAAQRAPRGARSSRSAPGSGPRPHPAGWLRAAGAGAPGRGARTCAACASRRPARSRPRGRPRARRARERPRGERRRCRRPAAPAPGTRS